MKHVVNFTRDGLNLVGHLFTPDDFTENGRYPAVIVQGSFSSVKEQMPDTYAGKFAAQGFVALAFDYAHYGQSDGAPRQLEDPAEKLADLQAATTYLLGLPYVEAVNAVGICTSASNVTQFAATDSRLAGLAIVAPALFTPELQVMMANEDVVAQRRVAGAEAKKKYDETGEQTLIPVYSESDPTAVQFFPIEGMFDYYFNTERGNVSEYRNEMDAQSWDAFLNLDGVSPAPSITAPTVVVVSRTGSAPELAESYYNTLTAEKELVWGDGDHFDYYDSEKQIDFSVENVSRFFRQHVSA